jgi:hypothetical protein
MSPTRIVLARADEHCAEPDRPARIVQCEQRTVREEQALRTVHPSVGVQLRATRPLLGEAAGKRAGQLCPGGEAGFLAKPVQHPRQL